MSTQTDNILEQLVQHQTGDGHGNEQGEIDNDVTATLAALDQASVPIPPPGGDSSSDESPWVRVLTNNTFAPIRSRYRVPGTLKGDDVKPPVSIQEEREWRITQGLSDKPHDLELRTDLSHKAVTDPKYRPLLQAAFSTHPEPVVRDLAQNKALKPFWDGNADTTAKRQACFDAVLDAPVANRLKRERKEFEEEASDWKNEITSACNQQWALVKGAVQADQAKKNDGGLSSDELCKAAKGIKAARYVNFNVKSVLLKANMLPPQFEADMLPPQAECAPDTPKSVNKLDHEDDDVVIPGGSTTAGYFVTHDGIPVTPGPSRQVSAEGSPVCFSRQVSMEGGSA